MSAGRLLKRNCVLVPEPDVVILEGIRDLLLVQSCQCRKEDLSWPVCPV